MKDPRRVFHIIREKSAAGANETLPPVYYLVM
jgi:hypothetical protein